MIDKIKRYLKLGFNFTNKNWVIIPIYFLMTMIIPFLIFLLIGLNSLCVIILLRFVPEIQFFPTGNIFLLILGFFIILFDIIIFSGIILIFSVLFTAIKASLKELMESEAKPDFEIIIKNLKYYFKRSFKLSFSFLVIQLLVAVVLITVMGTVAGVFIYLSTIAEEFPVITSIIGIFAGLIGGIAYLVFILAAIYLGFWKKTSDTYLILKDCEWKDAFQQGRHLLHENWQIILGFYVAMVLITMVLVYGIQMPIAMLSMIPIIGFIFGLFSWILQMAWTSYVTIFDCVVYLFILGDITERLDIDQIEKKFLPEKRNLDKVNEKVNT